MGSILDFRENRFFNLILSKFVGHVYDLDKQNTEQTFPNKHEVHAGILF